MNSMYYFSKYNKKGRWNYPWCLLFLSISCRVVAVFGSSPSLVDSSVASVCSALKVPYLTTHPVLASAENIQARKFAVHLGPSQNDLIQAVKDTIERLKWSEMALLSHRETGKLTFSHFKKKGEEKTFYELNDHFLILESFLKCMNWKTLQNALKMEK